MQAARTQTLLRIYYKGVERLVEPYSLKYQQRRDGVEREYFFAHKVSGGDSDPGMRSFVPEHMERVENTDTKFEPRHQIELSKAGEMPENRYRFDPNKPIKAPRTRSIFGRTRQSSSSTRGYSGMKYSFRCSNCGKKSTRNSYDSTRHDHKDKDGYPCYGFPMYEGTQ